MNKLRGLLIATGIVGIVGLIAHANANQPRYITTENTGKTSQSAVAGDNTAKPKIETKQVSETETVPFSTKTVDDSAITKGQSKISQAGKNGVKTKTYSVTYTNGAETSRTLVSEQVTTQPTDQIVHSGTYVYTAPVSCSGGYINVNGNCVPSPSSNPAGASAQCNDGTYSYSQNRSGTCSHHGGVARWL
jgi:hypothetical protein